MKKEKPAESAPNENRTPPLKPGEYDAVDNDAFATEEDVKELNRLIAAADRKTKKSSK